MKQILGSREWFSIPEYGLDWVRGKIDTGSRHSSLHGVEIVPFQKDGARWVRFQSIDHLECEAPVIFTEQVEDTHGVLSECYFIEVTVVTLNGQELELLVALTCRVLKKCPLSLGRRALVDFLVDSSQSQLLGKL